MSKYTTGEIAKLCKVTVRTVQYYDDRGILVPSSLSEGGRRLYSEDDLKRMHIICFLRELGISINGIAAVFAEKKPENVLSVLLEQQENDLRRELSECRARLELIEGVKREIKSSELFSVEKIADIARIMKQKNKLKKMRLAMVLSGIPVTALQLVSIILWITNGLWWMFGIWACVAIPWGVLVSRAYFRSVEYICPECHASFKPTLKEVFWAYHTPTMRRLTCPKCSFKGLCVEVYAKKEEE